MAGSTASLVVRILADIDSFTRGMSGAERELVRTGSRMQSIGQSLSLGVTLPFVALGAALSKSAAEDEASVKKLEHTFGTSTKAMEGFIQDLMKTVPATDDELRQLTSTTDTLLKSVGLGAPKAQAMTQAVTKLAGDLAAFNHVELGVAQSALEAALAGQTRGLKEFGVVISEADIKQRAYKMGLAQTGDELTHAATAQAAWSLILERTKNQQGEAARTIGDDANALARLRQSADSAADSFGAIFLPVAAKVVGAIDRILRGMADLPQGTKGFIVGIGGVAAVAGPAIFVLGSLVEKITLLNRALATVSGTTALAGLGSLASKIGPWGLLIGAALTAIALDMKAHSDAAAAAAKNVDVYRDALEKLASQSGGKNALAAQASEIQRLLNDIAKRRADLEAQKTALAAQKPAFDNVLTRAVPSVDVAALNAQIKSLDDQAAALKARFDAVNGAIATMNTPAAGSGAGESDLELALKHLEERAQAIDSTFGQLASGWKVTGLTDAWAQALERAFAMLRGIKSELDPMAVKLRGIVDDLLTAASTALPSVADLKNLPVAGRIQPSVNPIAPGGPGTVALGGVTLKAPELATLPKVVPGLSNIEKAVREGAYYTGAAIQAAISPLLGVFMQGNGARAIGGIGGAFGEGFASSLISTGAISLGLAGNVLFPIIGGVVGTALGGFIGGLFDGPTKSADTATSSLDDLAAAANKVTASITNIPQFFKVELERFRAAPLTPPSSSPSSNPGSPITNPNFGGGKTPTPAPKSDVAPSNTFHIGSITLSGVSDAKSFVRELSEAALRHAATGSAAKLAFAAGPSGRF